MDSIVIGSIRQSAGKTSLMLGLAQVINKKISYMKPFGDRLIYRKKHLWDYDSALMTNVLDLKEDPSDISIGFEHSKLRYKYDKEIIKKKLIDKASDLAIGKDILLVEGGKNISYGISVSLDALSVARYLDSKLIIVIRGDEDAIIDDIIFLKKYVDMKNINFGGVIINKVNDPLEFRKTNLDNINKLDIDVLGIIPYIEKLSHFSVEYLADYLFAKMISGEKELNRVVEHIFVGAASATAAERNPLFKNENKMIITGGDRTDMIIAALESNTSCILLTNNILPPPNIISMAQDRAVPMLLVSADTYQIAKQIDDMETLLTKNEKGKIELLRNIVNENVDIKKLLEF